MKNSKLARALKRLLGEEAGATMMEYVILAVMIAAAVTAAAIYFGNSATNQMNIAGAAMTGKPEQAATASEKSQEKQTDEAKAAHDLSARFSDQKDNVNGAIE